MKHPLLAALVLLAGCASPVVLSTNTAPSNLAPGQTRLVFQTSTSRALLSDAGFLTLALHALPAGETRYAAVPRAADGTYSLVLEGLTAGDWQLSVLLYPTSEDPTLLFFADQRQYLAPGTSNTIALKVYEPGTISGLAPTEAIVPTAIEVKNYNTAQPWIGPQTLSVGLPLRLSATLVDASAQAATDQRVEWSTSNPAAVTISPSGRVSPLQTGQAVLTAVSVANRNLSVSFTITVQSSVIGYWKAADGTIVKIVPSSTTGATHRISFVRPGPTNYQYETGPLTSSGIDQYNIMLNRQLSVLSAGVIDGPGYDGTLRDNRNGTLSLSGANLFPNTVFTRIIDPKPVTSMVLDVSNPSHLVATVLPADATIPTVLWASTNTAVATITPLGGVVTAVGAGTPGFLAFSLEDPAVFSEFFTTPAQGWLPSVSVTGPSSVTSSNPVATFSLSTNVAGTSVVQWLVDGQVVANRTDGSVAPLTFNTSNLSAGNHGLVVKVTDGTGFVLTSAVLAFTVRSLPEVKVASRHHTLYVKADGTLWGWGDNQYGQLGIGTITNEPTPVYIMSDVADVAVGNRHSLILKHDGTLWFAGNDNNGQAGNGSATVGDRLTPVQILAGGIKAIAAGNDQSWVLKTDGTLWAAGYNPNGNLGDGTQTDQYTFLQVASNIEAVYPSPNNSTLIVTAGGTSLKAAGMNGQGQLGVGDVAPHLNFTTATLPGATGTIRSVATGQYHSVVVTSTGEVWVTGYGADGQTGNGISTTSSFALMLGSTSGVTQAVAGDNFTVLLRSDGRLVATGNNANGQLGDGSLTARNTFNFVDVVRSQPVKALYSSPQGIYLVLENNSLWANGLNNGTTSWLGDGTTILQAAPVPISTVPQISKVFTNGNRTFVILADGTLKATGSQANGALGNGVNSAAALDTWVTIPTFSAGNTFVSVAPGANHTLFLLSNGSVWVSGANFYGQLGVGLLGSGDSNPVDHISPVQIPGVFAKAITAGNDFSMILGQDGFVSVFGWNSGGQLGMATTNTRAIVPIGVTEGHHAVAIAAGSDFGLILRADGTVYGAGVDSGNFHGQAGFATTEQTSYAMVPSLSSVIAIQAGPQFSFALQADGKLLAAGWNAAGQLGHNVDANTDTYFDDLASGFTQVWTKVKAVSAGNQHTLIQRIDGTLWGTGAAITSGSATNTAIPQFLGEALTISAGGNNSFVVRPDATLWWFGSDVLGNGIPATATATPQRVW